MQYLTYSDQAFFLVPVTKKGREGGSWREKLYLIFELIEYCIEAYFKKT